MSYVAPASVLLPIAVFLPRYRVAGRALKILFYFLLISAAVNGVATVMATYHMRNLPLLHLYTAVEGMLLFYYFRTVFTSPLNARIAGWLVVLFPVLSILNFAFLQSLHEFNTYTRPLEAILITACCFLYIAESSSREEEIAWTTVPYNWVKAGLLLYFPAAFAIFTFSNHMITSGNYAMANKVWFVHAILVVVMYVCFAIAFLKCRK